jgi:hypothetical protein
MKLALLVLLIAMSGQCGNPYAPSTQCKVACRLMWELDAPNCSPKRPTPYVGRYITHHNTGAYSTYYFANGAYKPGFSRISATFLLHGEQWELCSWEEVADE